MVIFSFGIALKILWNRRICQKIALKGNCANLSDGDVGGRVREPENGPFKFSTFSKHCHLLPWQTYYVTIFLWKRLCYNHTPGIGPKQVVSYFARHLNGVFNNTQRDYFSELLKNILSQIMSSLAGSYLLAPFAMPKSNKSCKKLPGKHISRCIPLSPSQGCPEPPN